jgi:transposase
VADEPLLSPVPADPSVEQLLVLLVQRDQVIAEQETRIGRLAEQTAQLAAQVEQLQARLGKTSRNSSKPPSSDGLAKPPSRSLRRKSGRSAGKQAGSKGFRLEPRSDPDEIVVHTPQACASCGGDLAGAPVIGQERRQVFDLPPIQLVAVEHRAQRRACGCGAVTTAAFPAEASAPTCYGPGVAALGTYLLARQHLPVQRAAEAMTDCFGAPVSTGWLATLLPAAEEALTGFTATVRERLRAAPVAHFDETGARADGKLHWIHVAATDTMTLYHLDERRGQTAMDAAGILPDFTGIAVHDGLASYRGYEVTHALCNAHHLRELEGIAELTGQHWPSQLADLLRQINLAVQAAKATGKTALPARRLAAFVRRYDALVAEGQRLNPPPARTGKRGRPKLGAAAALLRRLQVYREDVLRFAVDFAVAFDNNQAERDVRMVKLQQKISGTWRSADGAKAFLAVRSYLSTAGKQGQQALAVLRELFTGRPWIPATAGP